MLQQGIAWKEAWSKSIDMQGEKYFDDAVNKSVKEYQQKYGVKKLTTNIEGFSEWLAKNP